MSIFLIEIMAVFIYPLTDDRLAAFNLFHDTKPELS